MLRKRTRSHQKQQMGSGSDSSAGQSDFSRLKNSRNGSFFSIPALFVGLSNKGSSDYESAWSPTSPLDFRVFSGFGNPFAGSSRANQNVHQMSRDSGKVGLSIVDSLDDHTDASGKGLRSSDSKSILFGPGMRFGNPICVKGVQKANELMSPTLKDYFVLPQSLPKTPPEDDELSVAFENGVNPMSSYGAMGSYGRRTNSSSGNIGVGNNTHQAISPKAHILAYPPPGLSGVPLKQSLECLNGRMDPVSKSEIELSEDYTCVISHGPNPKTTHFYGDRVLESVDNNDIDNKGVRNKEQKDFTIDSLPFIEPADDVIPPGNFLSFCRSCNKNLKEEDIYMYRGYIAFCSVECRLKEILADEETEEAAAAAAKSAASGKGRKDLSEKKSDESGEMFTVG